MAPPVSGSGSVAQKLTAGSPLRPRRPSNLWPKLLPRVQCFRYPWGKHARHQSFRILDRVRSVGVAEKMKRDSETTMNSVGSRRKKKKPCTPGVRSRTAPAVVTWRGSGFGSCPTCRRSEDRLCNSSSPTLPPEHKDVTLGIPAVDPGLRCQEEMDHGPGIKVSCYLNNNKYQCQIIPKSAVHTMMLTACSHWGLEEGVE
ncbi:hypothetical protein U1Q18_022267 [Sarracenia purpurea var. burkii]